MNTAFLKSFQVLQKIYGEQAFSAIELNKQLLLARPQDKALVTKIVYGVLDFDIELDYILSQFVKKAKPDVRLYLKIGTYCLKQLSIPQYAVVNDIAELSKLSDDRYIVGFVNATLKAIAQALSSGGITYPTDADELLSVKNSYPLWAVKKLIKDYGRIEAEKIVSFKPDFGTVVRVNTSKITPQQFEQLLVAGNVVYEKTILSNAFSVKGQLNIDETLYTVQSLASMLVCHTVAATGKSKVLDCCAAPGGKSVFIKQLNPLSQVLACDIHPHRVALIESYRQRMGEKIDTCCCDSTVFNKNFEGQFDFVLCDVPCSGFGVLDTRPDIKLHRTSQDISNLMKTQRAILQNASKYVKPGGVLVYSTCTVFCNENSQIVDGFLKENENFCFSQINLPVESPANGRGSYQFLPHTDNVQGFYCARLINKR